MTVVPARDNEDLNQRDGNEGRGEGREDDLGSYCMRRKLGREG